MPERSRDVPLVLLDLAIGTAAAGLGGLTRGRDAVSRLAAPVTGPAARAARTVVDHLPAALDGPLRVRGEAQRLAVRAAVESWLRSFVARLVEVVLDQLDLTDLVVRRVDLDRVAQGLDVEAVLDRLDLTELVERRVDLDRVARGLDVEAVLDRLDLTELVIRRVDLDRVARGLDVEAVLDRLDLTELVERRVDLNRVARGIDVDAVAARIDLDAITGRINLIALAEYVVDGIDLPRLIRDSTGSVASEGVAGVRLQGMEADQALANFVDRLLRRQRRPPPEQLPASTDGPVPNGRVR